MADVPVGAFLSGGVDSTTVVALMKRFVKAENLNTVSVGFDNPGLDESEWIRLAHETFGTRHHHLMFKAADTEGTMKQVAHIYDEPVADPSSLPTLCLSAEARRWMTVALSGDGGDEVFGGYESRRVVAQMAIIRRVPKVLRRMAHALLRRAVGYRLSRLGMLTEALRVSLLPPEEYAGEIGATLVYRPPAYKEWTRARLTEMLRLADGNLTEAMLKFDIHFNRLGDNYAAKVDRMSMAHALEVRSPFLDYRLMEFSSRVPVKWKLTQRRTKVLMRELVRGLIPDAILTRAKHGFAGPLSDWVERNDDVLRDAVTALSEARVLGDAWVRFFRDTVFQSTHSLHREYKKRLLFLWKWYLQWGGGAQEAAPSR